jgi:beta-galactosidase
MTDQQAQDRGQLSRRNLLQFGAAGAAGIAVWSVLGDAAAAAQPGPAYREISFDPGWLFGEAATGSDQPSFDDTNFATVVLPHTVAALSWRAWDSASWERVWSYRKHFDVGDDMAGARVFLDFDAAMTGTTLTLNGHELPGYLGGYLPFRREVTDQLRARSNVLAVTLDSRFNLNVPPDRAAPYASSSVDYWQPGGIYRHVRLRAVPQTFVADVFAKPVNVLDPASRQVQVQCTVDSAVVPTGSTNIVVDLLDGSRKVASVTTPVTVTAGQATVTATLTGLSGVTLWDVDDPHLYTVLATLTVNDTAVHDYQVRIGFREARFAPDGFFLNGRRLKLFGVNRHQFFPFAGGAMPDRVQRKDAEILRRDLNCNMVRCSHYPQSEAFYDACDELGLMVWEEIPGWGYFGDAAWQAKAERDLHDMIVRDRNHASIVVWGAMPNESGEHVTQYTAWNQLAHSLDDSRPTGGDDFSRTDASYVFDVFSYHDYSHHTGPDGQQVPDLNPPVDAAGRPYLICEAVGTLSGPAKYYRRTDPQWAQQGQATAHARVQDISASDDRYCGLLAWSGYDYESGTGNQYQGVKYTGVVDLFRVPKPGAAIYQSQLDPHTRPVLAPAFYWDFGATSPVTSLPSAMICSNCDRLEVYVGGTHFATATPDTANYGHLRYPPSFVDFSDVDGSTRPELRIDGYVGSGKVISRSFSSDPAGDRLSLVADDSELVADGSDATRVVFRALDKYGAPRPYVDGQVQLSVTGPAVLVGDNPFAFADAGGVGAVWLRSLTNSPGMVTIRASHATLGTAAATLRVATAAPGGPPVPYGTLATAAEPKLVAAGGTTTVTSDFTDNGLLDLDRVALTIQLPTGWTARATTPTTFTLVKSGQSTETTWQVTAPADATPGQVSVTVQAAYTSGWRRGVTASSISLLVPYSSLAQACNNAGISDDSDIYAANFDGVGNSYSEQALTTAGLAPGALVTHGGIRFTWPDVPAGQVDNVVAEGQVVLASGSGSTLGFLGASSPTVGGTGTVYYTDDSTSSYTATLDNWFNPPGPENDVIAALPYINDTNPATNHGVAGRRDQTVYVFYVGVPITPGKTVRAVTLPAGGSIPSSGRITGMHVFAIGVG